MGDDPSTTGPRWRVGPLTTLTCECKDTIFQNPCSYGFVTQYLLPDHTTKWLTDPLPGPRPIFRKSKLSSIQVTTNYQAP
jgi:hypothetical protein